VVSGRRAGTGVRVSSVRAEVDVTVLPDRETGAMLALCRTLFGDRFKLRAGLLAVALSNVNPQNHLAIALCNFTRMERGEAWLQNDNITMGVGRLMEALDAERLAAADALGVQVRTLRRHFHLSFHTPEAPLGEMAAALAASGSNPAAPASLDTRYVLEDAPFGLYPTILLARLCGRPAVLHEAGLAMLSALYGRDLAADNDILPALGPLTLDRVRGAA
jgi:opine dehydrogenase